MLKALIFDADNTLYKSNKEQAYGEMYRFLSKKTGIDQDKIKSVHKRIIESVKSSSVPTMRRYDYSLNLALEEMGIENANKLAREAVGLFWKNILNDLTATPGTLDSIKDLKKYFRLVIATDEFPDIVDKKLRKVFGQWKEYFDFVITPEDVGIMKPSKTYYTLVLQRLGVSNNEVAVIGDSWYRDLQPAAELGMTTVLIAQKKEGKPDIWLKSMEGITDKLKKYRFLIGFSPTDNGNIRRGRGMS